MSPISHFPEELADGRSYSQDTMLGAGPRMEAPAQDSGQGGIPKADPHGADRGQEERPKTELKPLAEDQPKRHLSQEGDLHGWTADSRTTPPSGGSRSWGLGVSSSPGTRQSAGTGPLAQEPCGPTSSQAPDLVTPQGPQAGEGPCQCPVGVKASSHNSCLVWHHRAPPGEKPPLCDHCGGQAPLWSHPGAQLCGVHTDYPPCEQGMGAQTFPRTLQRTPLQQSPLVDRVRRCGEAFAWRAPLAPQELMQEAEEPLPCAGCGKCFGPNEQQLMGGGPSMCPQWGQASGPRPRAPGPRAQRLYACHECGRAFTRTSSLLQHKRIHTGERPYQCPECGKAFVRCSGLYRHQKTHSAERLGPALARRAFLLGCPPCGCCGKGAPRPPRGPVAGEKLYKCVECPKAFGLFSHLVEHRRVHTGEKPYACPECGKAFNQRSNLSRHQRTHSRAKPYACPLCEKAFKGRSGLVQHQRAHTGERPYSCPECGKAFRGCSELRQQKRVLRSEEQPFVCADCGKAFVRNCSLVRHWRTHTGERPYACGQCGRAFSQRSNLNEHRKRHAGGGDGGAPLPETSPAC
ncbi:LOW QUALITY PROTEIN: zinc finger protein 837 [Diceros bicornis minor]|uniref:LOW QUALITY PROTEIN: zinc finger protein 837 n=1 Tax=Diceros bicornis minor TaxID=77932 RepID=UPI0026EBAAF2|nr:LOW QUALITY PROTEIN: zinc finger protein 837 [Diceros bicornis minor]